MNKFFIEEKAREVLLSIRMRPGMYLRKIDAAHLQSFVMDIKYWTHITESISLIPERFFQLNYRVWEEIKALGLWEKQEGVEYFFERLDQYLERYGEEKIKKKLKSYEEYLFWMERYLYWGKLYTKILSEKIGLSIKCLSIPCAECYLEKQEEIYHTIIHGNVHCRLHGMDLLFVSSGVCVHYCLNGGNHINPSFFQAYLEKTPYLLCDSEPKKSVLKFFEEMCKRGHGRKISEIEYIFYPQSDSHTSEEYWKEHEKVLIVPKTRKGIFDCDRGYRTADVLYYLFPETEYDYLSEKQLFLQMEKIFHLLLISLQAGESEMIRGIFIKEILQMLKPHETELPVLTEALEMAKQYDTFLIIEKRLTRCREH